ncbi:uncharacterized protein PHACADRAFT_145221 [Phanerochaete carnosa HHB-10118-sp]|uniref:triacylglycerol lipase n=1 Tax=Phanerochaete carnosa (strain HHB-10118-sp) TaxID=650164 RepID=K5WAU7_PHACS|nr:uncharacterized protein PHACADRAFT_145221 [Phanerochaete carnosa HHB-10118-sp]EKM56114.1 hypothetical protein PHACADRAFT_145221 [Phanerochaete carnosa HHB-10118-sp]
MLFNILPATLQYLLTSYFWKMPNVSPPASSMKFELRHVHGLVTNTTRVVFNNVAQSLFTADTYEVQTRPTRVSKARSQSDFFSARFGRVEPMWDSLEVEGPNVRDRRTLQLLANMSNNAYFEDHAKTGWYDLGSEWNTSYPFGWEPDADGFRGHIFANEDNSTVVVSVKGTSAGWIVGGSGPTTRKDKLNDNLLFSCCCGRVGPTWTPVCPCYSGSYKCDQQCLEDSLAEKSLFYSVGINLYNNVTYMYPNANIWLIGHSLGGSLASLIGVTFGAPVVAFESPAEKLAASRLHLPIPLSTEHITNVYHTADPIPMGVCSGYTSLCTAGGYAMETQCHMGKVIRYDTVSKLGWSVDIRTHGIAVIVEKLLAADWEDAEQGGVPDYYEEEDCVDCFNWEYGNFKNTSVKGCPGSTLL